MQYLYINGILETSSNLRVDGNITNVENFTIGKANTGGEATARPVNGKIDDVAIFNYALTENEIKELYYKGNYLNTGDWILPETNITQNDRNIILTGTNTNWKTDGNYTQSNNTGPITTLQELTYYSIKDNYNQEIPKTSLIPFLYNIDDLNTQKTRLYSLTRFNQTDYDTWSYTINGVNVTNDQNYVLDLTSNTDYNVCLFDNCINLDYGVIDNPIVTFTHTYSGNDSTLVFDCDIDCTVYYSTDNVNFTEGSSVTTSNQVWFYAVSPLGVYSSLGTFINTMTIPSNTCRLLNNLVLVLIVVVIILIVSFFYFGGSIELITNNLPLTMIGVIIVLIIVALMGDVFSIMC
jgi:hypothetical protein